MRRLRIAVCKPDHLGDFVLALPALRQLQRSGADLTLFVATATLWLARQLCPAATLVALDLPHLRRDPTPRAWSDAYRQLGRLRLFDAVVFLRRDAFLHPEHFAQWTDSAFFIEDRNDIHQARLEQAAVRDLVGGYDVDTAFFGDRAVHFPAVPRSAVFAIGAGFPHKTWSPLLWAELGQLMQARGIAIRILSGPGERLEGEIIARALDLRDAQDVFVGGHDLQALEDWLQPSDVVIAVDGGSAHLCALSKPVLSLFGPSPIARFAPIGQGNRAVTRALQCSPCVGFDQRVVNACLSRECLYGLRPLSVLDALFLPNEPPGHSLKLKGPDRAEVRFGASEAPIAAAPSVAA